MLSYTKDYKKAIDDEDKLSKEKLVVHKVGKLDAKKHLETEVTELMGNNITQSLGIMLNTITF
jgi:26S proteasome regulatory subunit N11